MMQKIIDNIPIVILVCSQATFLNNIPPNIYNECSINPEIESFERMSLINCCQFLLNF